MIPSHLYITSFLTGSNYICNPPVTDTDIDQMFLVHSLDETDYELTELGWKKCGINEYAVDNWAAYRKDNLNALITTSKNHYDKFEAATELAKKRNLLNSRSDTSLISRLRGQRVARV